MASDPNTTIGSRTNTRTLYTVAVLVFVFAASSTLYFNHSMSGGMPMPGNWTMSMMWMPMGGGAVMAWAMFTAMWLTMMVAMMLPSTMPLLLLHRRAAAFRGDAHLEQLTFALAAGYFFLWTLFGIVAYLFGLLISRGAMHSAAFSHAVPVAAGLALSIAGIYQLTPCKSACLKHCRDPLTLVAHHLPHGRLGALHLGLHHGAFCAACCWGLMLIQLVLGAMNLAVMVAVAIVIALEKLLPNGEKLARATGVVAIGVGAVIVAKSVRSM